PIEDSGSCSRLLLGAKAEATQVAAPALSMECTAGICRVCLSTWDGPDFSPCFSVGWRQWAVPQQEYSTEVSLRERLNKLGQQRSKRINRSLCTQTREASDVAFRKRR